MSGAGVIWSLPHPNNGIHISKFGYVLLKVRTPVWSICGMGYWRGV